MNITIDLASYDVSFNDFGSLIIHDCMDSVLGKLDNRIEATSDRFSEAHDESVVTIGGKQCWLWFRFYDDHVEVDISAELKPANKLEVFSRWLIDWYDHIESIGWETLKKPTE